MMIKAAFIYVADGLDSNINKTEIPADSLTLYVRGCASYEEAADTAAKLVMDGIAAIELCAGFGIEGVAKVKEAVGPEVPVGVVRFDYHPALGFKSGDDIF
ncbi:MAG: DUF6506 family protein [Emergencia sp.]